MTLLQGLPQPFGSESFKSADIIPDCDSRSTIGPGAGNQPRPPLPSISKALAGAMPVLPDTRDAGWAVVGSGDDGSGSKIGNWSSLIGIITSIVGNILIALALNVQRYSHIQLGKRKAEARERAKEALRRAQNGGQSGYGATDHARTPHDGYVGEEDDVLESHPLAHSAQSGHSSWSGTTIEDDKKVSSSYLKSPSWWLGQILMTVGEMGNFLAYGFAPASIVSPLGVVALISNCVIAPIFFGEIFRARDFWGVVIAVAGAVTVVLSAKQEETKLDPHNMWDAISTMEFEIYVGVSVFLIIVLMWASPRYGNRSILIDLGLVGLFGKFLRHFTALRPTLIGCRGLHGAQHQRRFLDAVLNALESLYHPRHIRAACRSSGHCRHAGPICEQGASAVRLDPSHSDPVCPVHPLCDYRKRHPLP